MRMSHPVPRISLQDRLEGTSKTGHASGRYGFLPVGHALHGFLLHSGSQRVHPYGATEVHPF